MPSGVVNFGSCYRSSLLLLKQQILCINFYNGIIIFVGTKLYGVRYQQLPLAICHIAQNCDEGKFWRMLTSNIYGTYFDGWSLSFTIHLYTCKHCIVFKQFDRLTFDNLAGKCQKCQNFPSSKFCTTRYLKVTGYLYINFVGAKV